MDTSESLLRPKPAHYDNLVDTMQEVKLTMKTSCYQSRNVNRNDEFNPSNKVLLDSLNSLANMTPRTKAPRMQEQYFQSLQGPAPQPIATPEPDFSAAVEVTSDAIMKKYNDLLLQF